MLGRRFLPIRCMGGGKHGWALTGPRVNNTAAAAGNLLQTPGQQKPLSSFSALCLVSPLSEKVTPGGAPMSSPSTNATDRPPVCASVLPTSQPSAARSIPCRLPAFPPEQITVVCSDETKERHFKRSEHQQPAEKMPRRRRPAGDRSGRGRNRCGGARCRRRRARVCRAGRGGTYYRRPRRQLPCRDGHARASKRKPRISTTRPCKAASCWSLSKTTTAIPPHD